LNFFGNNIVSGTIGESSAISEINVNDSVTFQDIVHALTIYANHGTLNLSKNIITDNLYLNNDDVILNSNGDFTGNVKFEGNATLNISNITGNIDFANHSGIVNVLNAGVINGFIVGSTGSINTLGDATFNGTIGTTSPITAISFNGNGNILMNKEIHTGEFNLMDAVNVFAKDIIEGQIHINSSMATFNINAVAISDLVFNEDGIVNIADNSVFNGTAKASFANIGTINIDGTGEIIGLIGEIDKPIKLLNFNGGTHNLNDVYTTELIVNASDVNVVLNGHLTGNIYMNAAASNLTIKNGLTGNILFNEDANIIIDNDTNVTGTINSTLSNSGYLNVRGDSIFASSIGTASLPLRLIEFSQAGESILNAESYSSDYKLTDSGSIITANANINGNVSINATGGIININKDLTGLIIMNQSGIVNIADSAAINGSIITLIPSQAIVNFAGGANISGNLGSINNNLSDINFNGSNGTLVVLNNSVYSDNINIEEGGVTINSNIYSNINLNQDTSILTSLNSINGNIKYNGNGTVITAGNILGTIDFTSHNATLTLNGLSDQTLTSTISNANNATLNIHSNVTTNNDVISGINLINIGQNGNPKSLIINAGISEFALMNGNQNIIFNDKDSVLNLESLSAKTIIFHKNLEGFNAGGGILNLTGGTSSNILTIASIDGTQTLGTNTAKLSSINVTNNVAFSGGGNLINIRNVGVLNILANASLTDFSGTSINSTEIILGDVSFASTYILDTKDNHINNFTGSNINFMNSDSTLILKNSSTISDHIIMISDNIVPPANNIGIVEINSQNAGRNLTILGRNYSIGSQDLQFKELKLSGLGSFNIDPTIYSTDLALNILDITLREVNSNIIFQRDGTIYNALGTITGNVDFASYNSQLNLADGKKITGNINGNNSGNIEILGSGEITGSILGLSVLKCGDGNILLSKTGNHEIAEIQGNGTATINFANDFNLTGDINKTSGDAVNLRFTGGNNLISGVVGSPNNKVGNILIDAGQISFNNQINSNEIIISDNAMAVIGDSVTATNIRGNASGKGKVKFITNSVPVLFSSSSYSTNILTDSFSTTSIVNSPIGTNNFPLAILEIADRNVEFTNNVFVNNLLFSSATAETIILKADSVIGSIDTSGNKLHSIILNANLDVGALGNIGSADKNLSSITFANEHMLLINTNQFYSSIFTNNDKTGSVTFNIDDITISKIGDNGKNLNHLLVNANSIIDSNIYVNNITIAATKTAHFTGNNSNIIAIEPTFIDAVGFNRIITEFSYDLNLKNTILTSNNATIFFDKATLLEVPITGGNINFVENTWIKESINGSNINFAPNKYFVIEKDIKAQNISADKASLVVYTPTVKVNGDIIGADTVFGLGTNQLQYSGNAKLTGAVEINTIYDTNLLTGGNIEVQANSKIDLSDADSLVIKLQSRSNINNITDSTKYQLISSLDENGIVPLDADKISLDTSGEQNRFAKWQIDHNSLTLYVTDASEETLTDEFKDEDEDTKRFVKQIARAKNGDASNFKNTLGLIPSNSVDKEAVDRLLKPLDNIDYHNESYEELTKINIGIDDRIASSGSEDFEKKYGIWINPFYGKSYQDITKSGSGYDGKTTGITVGFDTLFNEEWMLGISYSRVNSKLTMKGKKYGDTIESCLNNFSIYGLYNKPNNNWFVEGITSYGKSSITNNEKRIFDVNNFTTATGTYKSTSFNTQILGGYNYNISETTFLTPVIGGRYFQINDDGYTETGASVQNKTFNTKSSNKFETIIGGRLTSTIASQNKLIISEIHTYVNYMLSGKEAQFDARISGIDGPIAYTPTTPNKLRFTGGGSLTIKYSMNEIGLTYNAILAQKYFAHQASLKLRVNL